MFPVFSLSSIFYMLQVQVIFVDDQRRTLNNETEKDRIFDQKLLHSW